MEAHIALEKRLEQKPFDVIVIHEHRQGQAIVDKYVSGLEQECLHTKWGFVQKCWLKVRSISNKSLFGCSLGWTLPIEQ